MGRHFDRLVELLNKGHINEQDRPSTFTGFYSYLCEVVESAAVFDFPLLSQHIQPELEKDRAEYTSYLRTYLDMSQEEGTFLFTPFPVTAVEDSDSVVIFESRGLSGCRITRCMDATDREDMPGLDTMVQTGESTLHSIRDDGKYEMAATPLNVLCWNESKKYDNLLHGERLIGEATQDILTCSFAAIQQIIYFMDPETFILETESKQSKSMVLRYEGKKKNCKKQRKTAVRPKFTIHSQKDLTLILGGEMTTGDTPLHIVKGHWRRTGILNPQGRKIWKPISQYNRGVGSVEDLHGNTYEVHLKTAPGELTPASEYKAKA